MRLNDKTLIGMLIIGVGMILYSALSIAFLDEYEFIYIPVFTGVIGSGFIIYSIVEELE